MIQDRAFSLILWVIAGVLLGMDPDDLTKGEEVRSGGGRP